MSEGGGGGQQEGESLCLFRLGTARFAIGLDAISEVVETGDVTPLPSAPDFLLGLANVRGAVVPVLDITPFVGGERLVPAFENPLLVLRSEDGQVGLMAHRVVGVRNLPVEGWTPSTSEYVAGELTDGEGILRRVDIARILRDGRRSLASQ